MEAKIIKPSEIPQSWYGKVIGLDIETEDKYVWSEICLVSIYNPEDKQMFVIPIKAYGYGLPITIDPIELNTLKEFLKTIRATGHNLQFDLARIYYHWGVECQIYLDTFIIARLFQEEVQGLKDLAMRIKPELRDTLIHFDELVDTKKPPFQYHIDNPQVVTYSALDAYLPFLIIYAYGPRLKKYESVVKLEMDYLWTAYHESAIGLRFDLDLFDQKVREADEEIEKKQAELDAILGFSLNCGSTAQKKALICEEWGLTSQFKTAKGEVSMSKESLARMVEDLEYKLLYS